MNTLKHLRSNKNLSFKANFIIKWKEQYRKSLNYYEPICNLSKLFKEPKSKLKKLVM